MSFSNPNPNWFEIDTLSNNIRTHKTRSTIHSLKLTIDQKHHWSNTDITPSLFSPLYKNVDYEFSRPEISGIILYFCIRLYFGLDLPILQAILHMAANQSFIVILSIRADLLVNIDFICGKIRRGLANWKTPEFYQLMNAIIHLDYCRRIENLRREFHSNERKIRIHVLIRPSITQRVGEKYRRASIQGKRPFRPGGSQKASSFRIPIDERHQY